MRVQAERPLRERCMVQGRNKQTMNGGDSRDTKRREVKQMFRKWNLWIWFLTAVGWGRQGAQDGAQEFGGQWCHPPKQMGKGWVQGWLSQVEDACRIPKCLIPTPRPAPPKSIHCFHCSFWFLLWCLKNSLTWSLYKYSPTIFPVVSCGFFF